MFRTKDIQSDVRMEMIAGGDISDVWEFSDATKSVRERCIRVAAMDIMASEGIKNIYIDKRLNISYSLGGGGTHEIEWI